MKKIFTIIALTALTCSMQACDSNKVSHDEDTRKEAPNSGTGIGATGTTQESGETGTAADSATTDTSNMNR